MHKIRERESLEIVDQTQMSRYVSRFGLYVPPSHRRISTNSSTQDFPHREPPLRIWANITRSIQLLSPTNKTSTKEVRHNTNHIYT